MAAALQARFGVAKGDRILVQSQNCNQMFESMFACFRVGAVFVPTNFRQTPTRSPTRRRPPAPSAMICNADFPDHAAAVRRVPRSRLRSARRAFGPSWMALVAEHIGQAPPRCRSSTTIPAGSSSPPAPPAARRPSVLTHGQMAFVVTNHLCDLMPGLDLGRRLAGGRAAVAWRRRPPARAGRARREDRADADRALRHPDGLGADRALARLDMFTVPTILKLLVEHGAPAASTTRSLRYVIYAGAPMYREDQKRALKLLGPVLVQYFGLGEVTGNITVLPARLHAAEDGPEVQARHLRLRAHRHAGPDPGRGRARAGAVRDRRDLRRSARRSSPATTTTRRPTRRRSATAGSAPATSAMSTRQGFLFITGRASDMYISGGSNVYPREIEEKILTHPAIAEVAVVGVPDPVWGEVGVAVCVAAAGAVTEAELVAFLDGKLARYKLPKRFVFWEALPKSAYGKITKKLVREELDRLGLTETSGSRHERS